VCVARCRGKVDGNRGGPGNNVGAALGRELLDGYQALPDNRRHGYGLLPRSGFGAGDAAGQSSGSVELQRERLFPSIACAEAPPKQQCDSAKSQILARRTMAWQRPVRRRRRRARRERMARARRRFEGLVGWSAMNLVRHESFFHIPSEERATLRRGEPTNHQSPEGPSLRPRDGIAIRGAQCANTYTTLSPSFYPSPRITS